MEPSSANFRCITHHSSKYHDIFISYRVNTEKKLADKLALLLDGYVKEDGSKVRTFLDSNCLLDGGDWEQNFLSALHHTTLLVLLISEDGLDLKSASHSNKTKIQAADREQDNCLLEYEYALDLKDKGLVQILVLCVSKDEKLGDTFCRAKFPSSPADIQKRLLMYSDTQEHHHRDGTKGPRVPDTMARLLSFITPTVRGELPTFKHIDPDDPASRIPDILNHLQHANTKLKVSDKLKIYWADIPFMKQKIVGFFLGVLLPILSLMTILTARNVRQGAIRYGVLMGHSFDMVGIAAYAFFNAFTDLPAGCGSLRLCMRDYYNGMGMQDEWLSTTINCGTGWWGCLNKNVTNFDCAVCFCDTYLFYCDDETYNKKVYLFLGLFALFISGLIYTFSLILKKRETNKKAADKV